MVPRLEENEYVFTTEILVYYFCRALQQFWKEFMTFVVIGIFPKII